MTYQFNAETMKALSRMLSKRDDGQRVHYVFGEGVNPRLRQLRPSGGGQGRVG